MEVITIITINDRFREVRLGFGKRVSQEAFAKEIGLSRSELKNIEYNKTEPKDFTIEQVCSKFGINERWLRYGELPKYQPINRNKAIKTFVDNAMKAESSDFRQRLLAVLAKLDTKEWELLEAMALKLAAEATAPKPYKLKIAGRDGSYQELDMTDDEKEAFMKKVDSLPDASDDL